jgi:glycine/D-amino acid oxidase-like deaminating enzyme
MSVSALSMYEEKSYWARDYGAYTPSPSLQEQIVVDVAVIGGGYTGLNAAREFKRDNPGATLAVLEGEVIGNGASGRNAGFNMTLFGLEPQITKLRWGKQRTADAYRYMVKAVNYTKDLIESNELDSDYSHPGFLRVAYSPSQVKTLRGILREFDELGLTEEMGMRWVESGELREEFNSPLFSAGLRETHTGLLHPTKHVRELKRLALEAGAEIYELSPATRITPGTDFIEVSTPGGRVKAGKVVLATNAYTHLLKGLDKVRALQFPIWTSVIVTEPLTDDQWDAVGWSSRIAMEDVRQLIHYFRPTADGRILIGGHDVHAPWGMHEHMDHDHNPKNWRALEEHLNRMFPRLGDVKVAYRWCGAVSVNMDLTPEIGFVGDERIICSTGCLGHGVSMTHLNGRLIADLLGDKKTELTDFWIVNRKAVRVPGKILPFLASQAVRAALRTADRVFERGMPG